MPPSFPFSQPKPMQNPRILIVRLSAVGDVIQSMPIACALRERFPGAFLAWAVETRAGQLLQGHEALDQLISLPRGWLKSPAGVWRLRRFLHRLRFDVAIEGQGLTKAAILAWLSGAPRRIGFGHPWGRELSRWLNTETVDTPGPHIVDRNLQLLRPLGILSPTARFLVPECAERRQRAAEMIAAAGFERDFAMINTGAGWPSKLWPAARFAAVAAHLGATWSLPTLVVWAGQTEQEIGAQIVAGAQGGASLPRRQHCRSWPRSPAGRNCSSVPTRGRCTWPPPWRRRAWDFSVPGPPRSTGRMGPGTLPCRRPASPVPPAGGAPPRRN